MSLKFNMYNVFIWVMGDPNRYKFRYNDQKDLIYNYLRIQVDNALRIGWPKNEIVMITNFPFEHMGVQAHIATQVCEWSSFVNKLVFTNEMIKKGVVDDNFWIHDCDLYQLRPFEFPPDCKDWGYTRHDPMRGKNQGASGFYRKEGFDIVDRLAKDIIRRRPRQEEMFMPGYYCREDLYKNRFSFLNYTYNLGIQHYFDRKYREAIKPIKAVHFHIERKIQLDFYYNGVSTFRQNRAKHQIVTEELADLFVKYGLMAASEKHSV